VSAFWFFEEFSIVPIFGGFDTAFSIVIYPLAVLFDIVLIAVIEFAAAIVILLISNHRAISDRTIWLQKLKTAFFLYIQLLLKYRILLKDIMS